MNSYSILHSHTSITWTHASPVIMQHAALNIYSNSYISVWLLPLHHMPAYVVLFHFFHLLFLRLSPPNSFLFCRCCSVCYAYAVFIAHIRVVRSYPVSELHFLYWVRDAWQAVWLLCTFKCICCRFYFTSFWFFFSALYCCCCCNNACACLHYGAAIISSEHLFLSDEPICVMCECIFVLVLLLMHTHSHNTYWTWTKFVLSANADLRLDLVNASVKLFCSRCMSSSGRNSRPNQWQKKCIYY